MSSNARGTSDTSDMRDELPVLGLHLEQIERYLASDGKIGMLSVTLLGRQGRCGKAETNLIVGIAGGCRVGALNRSRIG